MRNAGLDQLQVWIKIDRRNINNLRYVNDNTLMAESEEELKNLLIRVKEESEKYSLKLNIKKTKIMASGPITSWKTEEEKVETVTDFLFLGSKITPVTAVTKLKDACPLEEKLWQSCGFSSSHVQMWELNHKKGWVPKNWMLLSCGAEEGS